ncbi:MAG: TIGR04013 family B12-binding domain/radical SAM domain-containing protein [Smithella sp.]
MNCKTALIFYYLKENRNSYNALAGALEKYPDIKQMDVCFLPNEEELLQKAPVISKDHKKTIIGLSFTTSKFWYIKDLLDKLKKKTDSQTVFLAGGPHPTGAPQETLKIGFDLVINGEGEEALPELLHRIKNDEDYPDVKGLSYLDKNGGYVFTGKRPPVNINNYYPISEFFSKHGPIEITRGCPHACSYCQVSQMFSRKPRHRSLENILDCVKIMKRQDSTYFRFISPNAFSYGSEDGKKINYEKLDGLLSGIRNLIGKRGKIFFGSFPSEVRPEHVNLDTVNMVKKYTDTDNLVIGAQSGSQRVLDFIKRGYDVASIYKAAEVTRQAGLKANIDFIFGLPGETDEDVASTLKVIKDLNQMGAKIHAHAFMPLPQTPFKNENAGKISPSLKKELDRLCSNGIIYGQWQKQGKIAAEIAAKSK